MFIFGLFLGNPHLKNEKKSQSADNKQNFEILVPLRAKHLKPHNNRLGKNESKLVLLKVGKMGQLRQDIATSDKLGIYFK